MSKKKKKGKVEPEIPWQEQSIRIKKLNVMIGSIIGVIGLLIAAFGLHIAIQSLKVTAHQDGIEVGRSESVTPEMLLIQELDENQKSIISKKFRSIDSETRSGYDELSWDGMINLLRLKHQIEVLQKVVDGKDIMELMKELEDEIGKIKKQHVR